MLPGAKVWDMDALLRVKRVLFSINVLWGTLFLLSLLLRDARALLSYISDKDMCHHSKFWSSRVPSVKARLKLAVAVMGDITTQSLRLVSTSNVGLWLPLVEQRGCPFQNAM
jgi:hypothetical protein